MASPAFPVINFLTQTNNCGCLWWSNYTILILLSSFTFSYSSSSLSLFHHHHILGAYLPRSSVLSARRLYNRVIEWWRNQVIEWSSDRVITWSSNRVIEWSGFMKMSSSFSLLRDMQNLCSINRIHITRYSTIWQAINWSICYLYLL